MLATDKEADLTLKSFDDGNSDEARQFLLDRRCERNHPKRHRTQKRAKSLSKKKRQKIKHRNAVRARDLRSYIEKVREYWAGERENFPDA